MREYRKDNHGDTIWVRRNINEEKRKNTKYQRDLEVAQKNLGNAERIKENEEGLQKDQGNGERGGTPKNQGDAKRI